MASQAVLRQIFLFQVLLITTFLRIFNAIYYFHQPEQTKFSSLERNVNPFFHKVLWIWYHLIAAKLSAQLTTLVTQYSMGGKSWCFQLLDKIEMLASCTLSITYTNNWSEHSPYQIFQIWEVKQTTDLSNQLNNNSFSK